MQPTAEFGPYAQFVLPNGELSISIIDGEAGISRILRSSDYVKERRYLYKFIAEYIDSIVTSQGEHVSLISALTTLSQLCSDVSSLILKTVAQRYLDLVKVAVEVSPASVDLYALMSAIRLSIELRCNTGDLVSILIFVLNSASLSGDQGRPKDAVHLLRNNRDVLERLYSGILSSETEQRLDFVVQRLEQSQRT
jgi:hypothetical protein